jgi:hypothetical protein
MKEWAAVVTQILRTPYVYEDTTLEDAVAALNERIKKEAAFDTAKINTLSAGPARGLPLQKEEIAETELKDARNELEKAAGAAIAARKATPRPMAAFTDLIALNGVKEADRERTAEVLVPVLNAFMWWRWNVLHAPFSYTVEQVVDAEHLLDGMTAETDVPLPFFNASVTLRRDINEKRAVTLSPEEEAEKEATEKAVAKFKQLQADSVEYAKERKAAEARKALPGAREALDQEKVAAAQAARTAEAAAAGPVGSLRGSDADLAVPEFGIEMPEVRRSVLPSPVAIAPPVPPSNAVAIMRSSDPRGHTPFGSQIQGLPPPPALAAPLVFAPPPVPPSNAVAIMRSSDPRGHTPFGSQIQGLPPPPALAAPPAPAEARAARAARVARAAAPASAAAAGGKRRRGTPKRRRTRKARNSTFRRHRKH